VIQALREKSLLRTYEEQDGLRFGMYESIRAYAAERLVVLGGAPKTLARHAAYYIRRAERWAGGIDRVGGIRSLDALRREMENLMVIYQRASRKERRKDHVREAMRTVLALEPLLSLQGPLQTLSRSLDDVLERAEGLDVETAFVAQSLVARGRVRQTLGSPEEANADYTTALILAEEMSDQQLQGRIHREIGILARDRGDDVAAQRHYEQALEDARGSGDLEGEGRALNSIGRLFTHRGEMEEALRCLTRSREVLREVGARRHEGRTVANLAGLLMSQARYQAARERYEEALAIHREFRDRRFEGIALGNLAILEQDTGFLDDARDTYGQALALVRELGDQFSEGAILGYLGTLHHEEGRRDEARRCYTEAVQILRRSGDLIFEAWFRGCRAALEAGEGNLGTAESEMAVARRALEGTGYRFLIAGLEIHEAHLDLVRARRAHAAGDTEAAEAFQASAHRRAGQQSGGALSEDVRIAHRLLSRAIEPGSLNIGEVALVFTDVRGSTSLWDQHPEEMRAALRLHNELVRGTVTEFGGQEVKTEGDSFMIVFQSAFRAVLWCLAVQERLMDLAWPEKLLSHPVAQVERVSGRTLYRGLRLRMGVHVGRPERRPDPVTGRMDYFGPMVNRAARIVQSAQGGQILVSSRVWQEIEPRIQELGEPAVQDLGEHTLRGLRERERLVQILPQSLRQRSFESQQS
jgi:class 3 adenylate cyclase/Tfp pilus assembly protein PilF